MPSPCERIQATVSSVVPCAHLAWRRNQAPGLPWAVWYDEPNTPGSDDGIMCVCHRFWVELYQKDVDEDVQDALFDALRKEYGHVSFGTETYIESEDCYMRVYRVSEIERIEDV